MKVGRLAQLMALKYGFQSEAATVPVSQDRLVAEVKRDILDSYRNYFSRSAKDSMLQYVADTGEALTVELTYKMDKMVRDIDKLSPDRLMTSLNDLLQLMKQIKGKPEARQAVRDTLVGHPPATIKHFLVKFERSLTRAFSTLQQAALKLKTIVPDADISDETMSRQRGEATGTEIRNFMLFTPTFKTFGLDSPDVVEKLLEDPELRQKITVLMHAVKSGRFPIDGPEISTAAAEIERRLKEKNKTNLPALEQPELPPIGMEPLKEEE